MRTIKVEKRIGAAPEAVFDLITDHAGWVRFRGVKSARLLSEGDPPPNGVGAVRRLGFGPLEIDEEVTRYERPSRMDYLIVKLKLPFDHQGGTVLIHPDPEGSRVEWSSTFRVPVAVIGGLQERAWATQSKHAPGYV